MTREAALTDAVALHRFLAEPELESAILAEGNASVAAEEGFWIKGSGRSMATLTPDDLALVSRAPIVAALEAEMSDAEVAAFLTSVGEGPKPSVETFMHAALLDLEGITHVAHGHPVPLLGLLCAPEAEKEAARRYFPDEIVLCGPRSAFVPYTDPGLPLARAVRSAALAYREAEGEWPRCIWLANHGLVTLGASRAAAEGAFAMSVKAARVRLAGAKIPLSPDQVARIHTRPDEHARQRALGLRG